MQVLCNRAQILNDGGGFVLKGNPILDDRRKHGIVKRQTELAILSYVEYLASPEDFEN